MAQFDRSALGTKITDREYDNIGRLQEAGRTPASRVGARLDIGRESVYGQAFGKVLDGSAQASIAETKGGHRSAKKLLGDLSP